MSWPAFFRSQRLCACGHPMWAHPDGVFDRLLSLFFRTACRAEDCRCRRYQEAAREHY